MKLDLGAQAKVSENTNIMSYLKLSLAVSLLQKGYSTPHNNLTNSRLHTATPFIHLSHPINFMLLHHGDDRF